MKALPSPRRMKWAVPTFVGNSNAIVPQCHRSCTPRRRARRATRGTCWRCAGQAQQDGGWEDLGASREKRRRQQGSRPGRGAPGKWSPAQGAEARQGCSRRRRCLTFRAFLLHAGLLCLNSAHMYSIVDNVSRHIHNLDVVRRVPSWRLLLPSTNHVIRAIRCSIE